MDSLLERYPDALEQLEILKKDFLGLDKPKDGHYIKHVDSKEGHDERLHDTDRNH